MARNAVSLGRCALGSFLALLAVCSAQAQPVPGSNTFAPPPPNAAPYEVPPGFPMSPPIPDRANAVPASFATSPSSELFEPAETAARIGDQYILTGELLGDVNIMMAPLLIRAEPDKVERIRAEIDLQRPRLLEQQLTGAIDRKLMYIAFLRNIPAQKMDEAMVSIDEQIAETFSDSLLETLDKMRQLPEEEYADLARQDTRLFRLALLMKEQDLRSLRQLEGVLQSLGSSLKKQQNAFGEQALGRQAMVNSIDRQPDVTIDEMRSYYEANHVDFQVPARAKWQQITVRFTSCSSKEQAGILIAQLGNEVATGGAPFWAVAQKGHGINAEDGGLHDWTEWGDLEVSREINEKVFSIELNRLSRIITDSEGLHIVRVLDREKAHVIPFTEAQVEIKQQIQSEKRSQSIAKYIEELRKRTPVVFKRDFVNGSSTAANR